MLLVQKWLFFQLFFLGNIGQVNVFYDILERKKRLSRLQRRRVQKVEKLRFFQRGYPMLLVQKWPYFQLFFLGNIGHKNVFYDILEPKNACQGYKNNKFQKAKNWNFSKGVNLCFWSKKWPFFQLLFLANIGQESVFYDILERENACLGYKNKEFKQSKNWDFSKGFRKRDPRFWSKNGHFSNFFFRQYRPGKCVLRYSRTKKRLSRL